MCPQRFGPICVNVHYDLDQLREEVSATIGTMFVLVYVTLRTNLSECPIRLGSIRLVGVDVSAKIEANMICRCGRVRRHETTRLALIEI